jgi:hypothetical protein
MKIAICLLLVSAAWAQTSSKVSATPVSSGTGAATSAAPQTDAQVLTDLLLQVQSMAQQSDQDVSHLRVDKWKADAASKQQSQASADSIRRNLMNAIPDLVQRIQASPASLNANFRLYRNLNALYDTFSTLAESAGAFGSREQYDPLVTDVAQLDRLRHQVADRVDLLAGNNDAELARLRSQLSANASGAKPPTKIVVDDTQPKTKKKAKAASPPTQSSSQ